MRTVVVILAMMSPECRDCCRHPPDLVYRRGSRTATRSGDGYMVTWLHGGALGLNTQQCNTAVPRPLALDSLMT